jgi:hypothetical protein
MAVEIKTHVLDVDVLLEKFLLVFSCFRGRRLLDDFLKALSPLLLQFFLNEEFNEFEYEVEQSNCA